MMKLSGSGKKRSEFRIQKPGVTVRSGLVIFGLILAVLIAGLSLTGCGGGGGNAPAPTPTPAPGVTYKVIGVGVIMQSRSNPAANSIGAKKLTPAWKKIDLTPGIFHTPSLSALTAASMDLTDKIALIILAWDKVNGAGHYQVFYQGNKVWDSATVDTGKDPAFQADKPQAYLDLDDELSWDPARITTAGQYEFQVKALHGDTVVEQLPKVTASLGLVLQSLPVVGYSKPNLTWSAVSGTSEYRLTITGINPVTVDDGTVTYDISTLLSASNPAEQYDVYVDARALDGSGNPAEIARGIGGLNY